MFVTEFLPQERLQLRPVALDERSVLASWINQGRQEGVFRKGSQITEESVTAYQQAILASSDSYECLLVSLGVDSIGYLDFRIKDRVGEVLGLYLRPQFRGRGVGRHLLRWILAVMRERGCLRIEIEVFSDNLPSLRACESSGFARDEKRDREEEGRVVYTMWRSVNTLEFLSPQRRFCYRPLQDSPPPYYQDLYFHHLAFAEAITERLSQMESVEAVLGLGSIAHRFADSWSDLDIGVIGWGNGLQKLQPGEQRLGGLTLDLFVVDLASSPPEEWENERRQAFEEAVVLYARQTKVIDTIRGAVRLTPHERERRIGALLLELGWIGFQPRSWFHSTRYGYTWEVPYDLWIHRGSIETAHWTVNRALDLVLQLTFLVNGRHVPDPKWRRYLVSKLDLLPCDFTVNLQKIETCEMNRDSFECRAELLLSLIDQLVAELESCGLLAEDLYAQYLRTVDY